MIDNNDSSPDGVWVITRYITKNGKRIYPKNGKVFKFFVPRNKVR